MLFAFKYGEESVQTSHKGNCGTFNVQINQDLTIVPVNGGEGGPINDFYYLHGWFMWAAWGLISIIMILTNRHLKHVWWLHMWIHRIGGTAILLITLIFAIIAVVRIGEVENQAHNIMGFILLLIVTFIALGGIFTRSMLNRLKWNTKKALAIKKGHKVRSDSCYIFIFRRLHTLSFYIHKL
jgi:hypothetical protein